MVIINMPYKKDSKKIIQKICFCLRIMVNFMAAKIDLYNVKSLRP